MTAAAGLSLMFPSFLSCSKNAASGPGDTVSNVVLSNLSKNEVIIPADFKEKVLILHFWASWCPTCRGEMAALEAVFRKYKDKGVIPCSIGIGEKKESALSYMKNMTISYPVLLDPDSLTRRLFGISGIPTYYLLDRRAVIRRKILGQAGKSGWDDIISTVL
jgi:cytochrome c biogenesis protein CcmG, thiol:disulfide interchange protein DsbE